MTYELRSKTKDLGRKDAELQDALIDLNSVTKERDLATHRLEQTSNELSIVRTDNASLKKQLLESEVKSADSQVE